MVFMPHWPKMIGSKPIDLGLDRIIALMERLDNPQEKLPPVIHVAGTNGKGSTIAFLRAILRAAGYKVHTYTSPHLQNFNERIKLNDYDISDEELFEIMEECKLAAGDDIKTTFFEGTTAGAFLAFSRHPADVILLETGLGGRLDATNIIKHPAATVFTPIAMDHMEYLGPTLELIAGEKAGILKEKSPAIISMQYPDVMALLLSKAESAQCPASAFSYDWSITPTEDGFTYHYLEQEDWELPQPSLIGEHQYVNAATAITALKHLPKFKISKEHIEIGLRKAKWPGRLQQITYGNLKSTLPEGWELWVDGAHNEASAYALSRQMELWGDKPIYLISGITRGRDPQTLFKYFKPYASYLVGANVETEPSATAAEKVSDAAKALEIPSDAADTIEEAIELITSKFKEPGRILCCGSLYLVSDVLSRQ
jgi:dihydrofolate synthase/folylpolyglutamate synthase